MKKFLCVILALILALSLVACGGDSGESSNSDAPANEETAQEEAPVQKEEKNEITFDSLTVVDNEECSIVLTGIDPDGTWGYTVKAQFENKSADKIYMFAVRNAAVNGVQADPFFATEVAAGKKAVEGISFSNDCLKENGIDFSDIEIIFSVSDSNDWTADPVALETVHVYPYGEDKATQFVREAQESDIVLIDNEYASVIVTGIDPDDMWGYTLDLFLLNKTDKELMFSVDEASINGFMADPFYASSVMAGKCEFSSMSWSDTTLEESGIESVEEIEFALSIRDSNDWFADDFVNEIITITP